MSQKTVQEMSWSEIEELLLAREHARLERAMARSSEIANHLRAGGYAIEVAGNDCYFRPDRPGPCERPDSVGELLQAREGNIGGTLRLVSLEEVEKFVAERCAAHRAKAGPLAYTRSEIAEIMRQRGFRYVRTCAGRISIEQWAAPREDDDRFSERQKPWLYVLAGEDAATDWIEDPNRFVFNGQIVTGLWRFTVDPGPVVPKPTYDREPLEQTTISGAEERGTAWEVDDAQTGKRVDSSLHCWTAGDVLRSRAYYKALCEEPPDDPNRLFKVYQNRHGCLQYAGMYDVTGQLVDAAGAVITPDGKEIE